MCIRDRGGTGRVWIVIESVYSMDGDIAPLDELIAIADRHDAFLMVDEAHGTGVYGEQGRGLTAPYEGRDNLVIVHTCGEALRILQQEPERQQRLAKMVAFTHRELDLRGWRSPSRSQIVPYIVGDNARAMQLA